MDIESFNRELAKKIAIANSHEKHNELKKAINAWISITEITLNISKDPKINSTYRTMLIKKTEQILQHIKELKVKLAIPKPVKEIEVPLEKKNDSGHNIATLEKKSSSNSTHKIVENSEIEGIPEGFLEIKPSNEFKILTPHEELDKEILKNARKVYKLDDDENENVQQDDEKIVLEQSEDSKIKICFACGTENPSNAKKCKSCKIDLV